jgi:outer membrane lipoprotein-sorting protein
MRIKFILTFLILLASIASFAQDNNAMQEFKTDLKALNKDVSSIKCQFVQTREISVLADKVDKSGVFYFLYPGNILFTYDDGDYTKITEEFLEIKSRGKISTTKVSSNPMLKNISTVMSACINADFSNIAKVFTIDARERENEWIVTLAPQRGKAASKIANIVLEFEKEGMSLDKLILKEKSGDSTTYTFSHKQFNIHIDNVLFDTTK